MLWTKLLPIILAVALGSCFVLGTTLVLPELLSGALLAASCVVGAALFMNILCNLAAAVLRSPGMSLAFISSLELACFLQNFVSCMSVGVYSMQDVVLQCTMGNMQCAVHGGRPTRRFGRGACAQARHATTS